MKIRQCRTVRDVISLQEPVSLRLFIVKRLTSRHPSELGAEGSGDFELNVQMRQIAQQEAGLRFRRWVGLVQTDVAHAFE